MRVMYFMISFFLVIHREKRADIVGVEGKEEGGPGLVWMSPQSAKMETRRTRWIDVNG